VQKPEPRTDNVEESVNPIVVETPTGPILIEVPVVSDDVASETVVVDTPTGPAVIEVPVVSDDVPTTTVVVDTPTGPAVVELPVDTSTNEPSLDGTSVNPSGAEIDRFDEEDWNLLSPSHATIHSVNADLSPAVSSEEIFQYLAKLKDDNEMEYALTKHKYERTFKCVSAGLANLAKDSVSEDEYHDLIQWMYTHCAAGNGNTDLPSATSAAPAVGSPSEVDQRVNDSPSDIDRTYMTKLEFYYAIKNHFMEHREAMFGAAMAANLRSEVALAHEQKLQECIAAAADRFGTDGGEDHSFQSATEWVRVECMAA
jgi:hypothetical protein